MIVTPASPVKSTDNLPGQHHSRAVDINNSLSQ